MLVLGVASLEVQWRLGSSCPLCGEAEESAEPWAVQGSFGTGASQGAPPPGDLWAFHHFFAAII